MSNAESIAIIGMGCRFPGSSNNVDDFWKNIKEGKDCVTEVPSDRWSIEEYYHENDNIQGKTHSKCGGFIDEFDQFDAKFFGVNDREAEQIDPQQRQMLEITWEAFENAGLKPKDYVQSKTGVFIGGFTLDYKILQFSDINEISTHAAVGSMMTMLSNRISYIYDLRGPAMSIDTACSSSLVAVHEACMSLKNNECNMALAGGIELVYAPEYYIAESKGGFLSKDGRCKTFDASANGYVRGEGGGIILLKRLSDAVKDGDFIYAVVRESLVNQDGKTSGITVPSGSSQKKLLEEVYERADIKPEDVQYVELHGTGTGIGDPIEANTIGEFFGEIRSASDNRCTIASVKANIGHLEAACGVASIIKSIFSMREGVIAPHIGMKELNPKIDIDKLKLHIPIELEAWPDNGKIKTIGVNSFGFGGTNAHVILQEYKAEEKADGEVIHKGRPALLTVSAKSEESLLKLAQSYSNYLEHTEDSLDEICYNAIFRREQLSYGLGVYGNTKKEISESLNRFIRGDVTDSLVKRAESKDKRIAFVYTGMGPQWHGMGLELYESDIVFREEIERVDKEFSKYQSWSIIDEMKKSENDSRIERTDVAQPMNFAIQAALTAMWKSMGIVPDLVVGHSVGEVASMYAAGVYTLEDAVKISAQRSKSQQKLAGKGTMLAVGLSAAEVNEYIKDYEDTVSIGAINSNTNITLSGKRESLEIVAAKLEEKEIFNRFLKVTIPYHGIYMNEIKDELLEGLKDIQPQKSNIRLYTTAEGIISDGTDLDNQYWWRNVVNPVHFAKAAASIMEEGYTNFIEIGPHPVLAGSLKEIAEDASIEALILCSVRRKEPEMKQLYRSYAAIVGAGCNVNWQEVYEGIYKKVSLPLYQWNHKQYWKEPEEHKRRRLGLKDHVLLGYRSNSILPIWEAEVNDFILPYVKDHCINGRSLIAGAHFIETALQVQRTYSNKSLDSVFEIQDIAFKKAVFLDENNTADLSIRYDEELGRVQIYSSPSKDRKKSALNFQSEFRRRQLTAPLDKVNLDSIRSRCTEILPSDKCYELFESIGFNYGPMFNGIKEGRIGTDETLCELHTLNELNVEDKDMVLHPVLLDAAFQSIILLQFQEKNSDVQEEMKLPVSVDRITVYGKVEGRVFVHARFRSNNPKEMVGDIAMYSETGQLLADIKGFTARILENDDEHALLSEKELNEWMYQVEWKEQNREDDEPLLSKEEKCTEWIIFDDNGGFGTALSGKLSSDKQKHTIIRDIDQQSGNAACLIQKDNKEDYMKLLDHMEPGINYGIVFLWCLDQELLDNSMTCDDIEASKKAVLNPIRLIINTLNEHNITFRMWVVSKQGAKVLPDDRLNINHAPVFGMGRVISHNECTTSWGANIDIDNSESSLDMLYDDLNNFTREDEIAYRNGKRYIARLVHVRDLNGSIPFVLDQSKYYIVTGGLGSLGMITINWMYERGARHFILIGRTKPDENNPKDSAKIEFLKRLERNGAAVEMVYLNIADEPQLSAYIKELKSRNVKIGGVYHIAGMIRDTLMMLMTQEDFDAVYDAKAKGAWTLSKNLWDVDLDFFVMYSSAGSVVSSVGQVNYAAGNAFMDALALYRRSKGLPGQSLGWGPWGVGMVKEMDLIDHYKNVKGMEPIYAGSGMQALERVMGQDNTHIVICGTNWPLALTNYPGKPPLFNYLAEEEKEGGDDSDKINLLDQLASTEDPEERLEIIIAYYTNIIADVIYTPAENIGSDEPLNMIGVDSLIATEIRNKINMNCGVTIAISDILGGITIHSMAEKSYDLIMEQIAENEQDMEDLLDNIENMTEEEILQMLNS